MDYIYEFRDTFKKVLKKLDPHTRRLVYKRIEKILKVPHLGKPLSWPFHGFCAERLENLRIVYKIEGNVVKFYFLEDRGRAYER